MLLNDMHTDWDSKDNDTRPAITILNTNGQGFWTSRAACVRITELRLDYDPKRPYYGELRVHFNTDDWRPNLHGLIYTDQQFEDELRVYLNSLGLPGDDVEYSEQGMQGDNYVSCDAGAEFVRAWRDCR